MNNEPEYPANQPSTTQTRQSTSPSPDTENHFPELKPAFTLEEAVHRLDTLMRRLRTHCPWDRKQTFQSLRHLTIEEVYELSEGILAQDPNQIQEELGDLLLHIFFYAKLAEEKQWFSLPDVINTLCDKLIRRHPHVYGTLKATSAEQVKQNWERLKKQDNSARRTSIFASLPRTLPSLIKAYRIQEKASHYGFDWSHTREVLQKVQEEWEEFQRAIAQNDQKQIQHELGDLLFALVNLARFLQVNPDDALEEANQRFLRRFQYIEAYAQRHQIPLENLSLDQMNQLWEEAKHSETTSTSTNPKSPQQNQVSTTK